MARQTSVLPTELNKVKIMLNLILLKSHMAQVAEGEVCCFIYYKKPILFDNINEIHTGQMPGLTSHSLELN